VKVRRLWGVALTVGAIAIVVSSLSARADTQQVDIKNTSYMPRQRTVTVGDTVTWVNLDSTAHSVTADDGSFDSSPACIAGVNCMAESSSFTYTFNDPGTFTYHCRVHGQAMTGSIIVEVEATTTTTTSTTEPTTTTTTTSSETSAPLAGDQSSFRQYSLPSLPSGSPVALPKSIIRSRHEDDLRPWVFAAVGIAGVTTIVGIALVRRGRVPFG
jgi:plastocyanin